VSLPGPEEIPVPAFIALGSKIRATWDRACKLRFERMAGHAFCTRLSTPRRCRGVKSAYSLAFDHVLRLGKSLLIRAHGFLQSHNDRELENRHFRVGAPPPLGLF